MQNAIERQNVSLNQDALQAERPPWKFIYGFFLLHMLMFGSFAFVFSYSDKADFGFNFAFSGFAIVIYSVFYVIIFGIDEVKWLVINSAIGVLGIISQLDWILGWVEKSVSDFPIYVHIIPAVYFVLYTFLLRRAVLHLLGAHDGSQNKRIVDIGYVVFSVGFYLLSLI